MAPRRARHGFDVGMFGSSVLWTGWVVLVFSYGLVCATRAVLGNLRASLVKQADTRRYAHFEGLAPGNLPRPCKDGRSHEIVTWYLRWNGRPAELDAVTHTVQGQVATTRAGRRFCRSYRRTRRCLSSRRCACSHGPSGRFAWAPRSRARALVARDSSEGGRASGGSALAGSCAARDRLLVP